MSQSYFVTGTDTGVGKTVISTILARGLNATYWKPIQTGKEKDSEFVQNWLPSGRIAPSVYEFKSPVSPHLASRLEGGMIDIERCSSAGFELPRPLVVEGAGGVLVPVNEKHMVADLISALRLPVVIVAKTELGTINHTLLTIEALRARKIEIGGFITNGRKNADVERTVSDFRDVPHLGHVENCEKLSNAFFDSSFKNLLLP